jgi:hypothetical protein
MPVSPSAKSFPGPDRPECMVMLGLMPPYSADDVKHAYLAKVKQLHPDHDGNRADFDKLQEAYQQAQVYVIFRGDRRGWIAAQVENYLAIEEIIKRLQAFGADVQTGTVDWLQKSFGEFAALTASVVSLHLAGAENGDEVLHYLFDNHDRLLGLRRLELPSCKISDESLQLLSVFRRLTHLNLNNTPVTWQGLQVIRWLPELETLDVDATGVNWWERRKLKALMRKKRKLAEATRAIHPTRLR